MSRQYFVVGDGAQVAFANDERIATFGVVGGYINETSTANVTLAVTGAAAACSVGVLLTNGGTVITSRQYFVVGDGAQVAFANDERIATFGVVGGYINETSLADITLAAIGNAAISSTGAVIYGRALTGNAATGLVGSVIYGRALTGTTAAASSRQFGANITYNITLVGLSAQTGIIISPIAIPSTSGIMPPLQGPTWASSAGSQTGGWVSTSSPTQPSGWVVIPPT